MNKKVTGILSYCTVIGWLIAFFAGEKENAKFHLNQGLVLAIVEVACIVVSTIVSYIPFIGGFLGLLVWLVNIGNTVLMVLGIISAAKDEEKALPIVGGITILK